MENWDLSLVALWSVAAISLLLQVYLFVTWPSVGKSQRRESPTGDVGPSGDPGGGPFPGASGRTTPPWEAPTAEVLDGIFPTSPSWANGVSRARRKKTPTILTLKQRLVRAGIYRKGGMRTFHGLRWALTLSALVLGACGAGLFGLAVPYTLAISGSAGLAAYLLPSFWLDQQLRVRQTIMRRALPDALDLVTVCIQGGLSLPGALARVARELGPAHPVLATELSIVEREIQMGRTTGEAMMQFAQRFNLEELRSLSSVIGQTEKYGGSIASALKTFAEGLRTKRRQRAEEMAQKAAVKLLFPTLLCIFPGIFVVVLGPTAARMYEVMSGVSWGG